MVEKFRSSKIHNVNQRQPFNTTRIIKTFGAFFVYGLVVLAFAIYFLLSPPGDFKTSSFFVIEEGLTFDQVATALKDEGYVRSKIALKIIHRAIFLQGNGAVAGKYFFEKPLSTFQIAQMIDSGDYNTDLIRVTIPEGLNKYETAEIFSEKLPESFDPDTFIKLASEGYMFPDTYFLSAKTNTLEVIEMMRKNFDSQIQNLLPEIEKTGRSLEDTLIMASIVETEARKFETRRIVADILWKRFDDGMPLQVDVTFKYINGKTTFDLTKEDLDTDSPYNTYKYAGLPPTPIANPGLDSIRATINPEPTDYYYFLTGQDGVMYYASNFEGHKRNRELYLK